MVVELIKLRKSHFSLVNYFSFNIRKFVELPYLKYKLEASGQSFAMSSFLTDLSWLHEKLTATGCVHLLNDICLANLVDNSGGTPAFGHLVLLKKFIEENFKALNYDGQQLFSLLYVCIEAEKRVNGSSLAGNEVLKKWLDFIDSSPVTYLQKVEYSEPSVAEDGAETKDADKMQATMGYDLIMNLNIDGFFVISLSTEREEICVWDVAK